MNPIYINIEEMDKKILHLGFVGENEHTRVIFQCDKMFAEYPDAVPALSVKAPKGNPYPVIIQRDGNNVIWDVKDSSLTVPGSGEVQLTFTENNKKAKSFRCKTNIEKSVISNGTSPDPIEDFVTEAETLLEGIPEQIAEALQAAKDSHEFDGADGVSPTVTTSPISGGHSVNITDRTGNHEFTVMNGQNGVSPDISVTDIQGGHRVTITDVSGTNTFDIPNGDPTTIIDDAAGEGVTNKVVSADKHARDHQSLMTSITEQGEEIKEIVSDLADQITKSGYVHKNGTINSNSNDTKRSGYIPVKAGDIYRYDLRGISDFAVIAFFTDDDPETYVSANKVVGNGNDSHVTGTYTIPQDGYIMLTNMISYTTPMFAYVDSIPDIVKRLDNIDGIWDRVTNLADKITTPGYVASNGTVNSSSNDTKRSTYIPVKAGTKYYYNLKGITNFKVIAFFTSNSASTYVSGVNGMDNFISTGIYTVPDNGYIMLTSMNDYASFAVFALYESLPTERSIIENNVLLQNASGKYILNFGDSLADGAGAGNKSYADYVATETGATLIDCSSAGKPYARYTDSDSYACVVNQVVSAISEHSAKDVAIIFVEGGINDLKSTDFSIGTMNYSYDGTYQRNTIIGASDYIFYALRNTFPKAKIVFVMYHHMPIEVDGTYTFTDINERQEQEHEAFVKVCTKWGIPIADVFAEGQLNSQMEEMAKLYFNAKTGEKWNRDIAHPNALAYRRFYMPLIREKLKQTDH